MLISFLQYRLIISLNSLNSLLMANDGIVGNLLDSCTFYAYDTVLLWAPGL